LWNIRPRIGWLNYGSGVVEACPYGPAHEASAASERNNRVVECTSRPPSDETEVMMSRDIPQMPGVSVNLIYKIRAGEKVASP
jgi:hypothetical protein